MKSLILSVMNIIWPLCADSTWSRFFRNAELERLVDQDLSRLYPEHGSYFQTPGCQGMLRRILLLWCLKNPECGYRQGKFFSQAIISSNTPILIKFTSILFMLIFRCCYFPSNTKHLTKANLLFIWLVNLTPPSWKILIGFGLISSNFV
jgi:hypothetical protein